MAVCPDDWTLSGLSGAIDWTVILPPGALRGTSPSGIFERSHSYPSLYTELTPTVLTGSESASAVATPILYARLSSIMSVEKVGSRQLRLRQQLGCPGSYRLLFLTAPSEDACDDWWRALHRLTYNNSTLGEDILRNASTSSGGEYPWHQREDGAAHRGVAEVPRAEDGYESLLKPSASPSSSPGTNDVVALKSALISPTPHSMLSSVRPSLHLSASLPSLNPSSQISSKPLRQEAAVAPSASSAASSLNAIAIDTTSTTSVAAHALAATATPDVAAVKKQRHFRCSHRHEGQAAAAAASDPASAGAAPPASLRPAPPLVVLRATRSEATQTMVPLAPAPRPIKALVAPPLHSLLQDESRKEDGHEERVSAKWTTTTPHANGEIPPDPAPSKSAAHAKSARLFSPVKVSTPLNSRTEVEQQAPLLSLETLEAVHRAAAPPCKTDENAFIGAASSVPEPQRHLEPIQLHMDAKGQSASPSPEEGLPLPASALKIPRARLTTAAIEPFLYEPLHIETAAVPRARSTSPLSPAAPRLRALTFSNHSMRPLSWCGQGLASSWTPRITYGSPSPYGHRGSAGLLLNRQLGSSGYHNSSSYSSPARQERQQQPSRSSVDNRRHRSCSASPLGRTITPGVSPQLSVIARPHLFLKHPVQVPPLGSRGTPTSAERRGGSVATYIFVTTDEDCVVVVPANHFKKCVEEAKLLKGDQSQHRGGSGRSHRSSSSFSVTSMPIGVRSYARARRFFGDDHCRAIRVSDVDRVTRGNEEPLILLERSQRERFRDPSKLVCIASLTHAFFMEATNSTEAEWYVRSWKKFLRARRMPRRDLHLRVS
ncbi:hypothetical protein ABL78_5585 [Leptomonas seymouri]|uniref:Kinetoplastid PH-like domain-containing protein n=1 Tax=Leptomonas seymouri TaxID=5684 RepID=A0A0N1HWN2_LEPSE|nr:hypothetical protein ABL78_5585 [Leptomonas seymouri]|eukprot:KPI85361.1 hypothetical protein ABL78_5585 [Leptomonas seymouri]